MSCVWTLLAKSRWRDVATQADLKSTTLNAARLLSQLLAHRRTHHVNCHRPHAMHTNAHTHTYTYTHVRLVATISPNAAPVPLHLQCSGRPLRAARTWCMRSNNACFLPFMSAEPGLSTPVFLLATVMLGFLPSRLLTDRQH